MKKFLILFVLAISMIGLNAQTIGSYTIVTKPGYELQYTATKLSPAECSVKCVNLTSENAIDVITIDETIEIEGTVFSVTSVADNGFAYCYSARKFVLPNTIKSIGSQAFYYCNLATEIVLPETLNYIGDKCFYGCQITEMTIPDGIVKISNSAFELCTELTRVEIPKSVTNIGIMAFKSCTRLTEIELPENIINIADYAFSGCTNLKLVRCLATVPPTGNKIFYKTPEDLIIRVPAESLELYRTTEPWSKYDIRKIGSENINEEVVSVGLYPNPAKDNLFITTEETVVELSVFDVYGRQHNNILASQQGNETNINVSNLNNGVYFVRVKTENSEIVKRFVKE